MKTILVPIDFSSVSDDVVREAAILAKAQGGRVVFVAVVQPPVVLSEYAPLMDNIAELTAAGEKYAARQLEALEAQLAADSVPVESVQLNGPPVTRIIEQADKFLADYIVMGSHGHTALYDLLVGSTTHGVLMRAKCPVVIVPAPRSAPKQKAKTKKKRSSVA